MSLYNINAIHSVIIYSMYYYKATVYISRYTIYTMILQIYSITIKTLWIFQFYMLWHHENYELLLTLQLSFLINVIIHSTYYYKATVYRMAENFGGEFILADWWFWEQSANISIRQTFYSMMSSYVLHVTLSICRLPSFKMSARKLQT